ncbi:MAG TPA: NAD(P)-dependent oxidoreductase, partial [Candidatus Norongarragalinales archaeon]|nr:NAD(P)-dependent oxidoreductase [Candidatus Norongarragalinales archaeon]
MKILITDKIGTSGLEYLKSKAHVFEGYGLKGEALAHAAEDVDGWMIRSGTQVTASLIGRAKKLKVIARAGSGVDNVDVNEATRRGILVVNAPAGNAVSAAEMTVALLLCCARKIPQSNASLHRHEWKRESFKGFEIFGKTVGLLGLGAVGKTVARILKGFGAHILAFDPLLTADMAKELGVTLLDKNTVIQRSDILSVHV